MEKEIKHYSKCNKDKSLKDFHKDKTTRDGYYSICKECVKLKPKRESTEESRLKKSEYDKKILKKYGFKKLLKHLGSDNDK